MWETIYEFLRRAGCCPELTQIEQEAAVAVDQLRQARAENEHAVRNARNAQIRSLTATEHARQALSELAGRLKECEGNSRRGA